MNPTMTLLDPDADVLQTARKLTGLIIGITVFAAATAFSLYYIQQDAPVRVFLAAIMAWGAYLLAHYAVSGRLVHQPAEHHTVPTDRKRLVAAIIGFLLLVAGLTAGFTAVGQSELLLATIAFIVAFTGYVITHYGITGTLL